MNKKAINNKGVYKLLLVISFFISPFSETYSQTDSTVLSQHNSLSEWRISDQKLEGLLNKHFKGGSDKFLKAVGKNLKYPDEAKEMYFQPILLINYKILNDTSYITQKNKVREIFSEEVIELEDKLRGKWKNTPKDGLSINLALSFYIHGNSNAKKDANIKDANITVVYSIMSNPSLDKGKDSTSYSMNYKSEELLNKVKTSETKEDSLYFLKEYLQRNPFSKEGHEIYYDMSGK